MTLEQRIKWLQAGSAMVVVFGIVIALGAHPSTNGIVVFLADVMIWPLDGAQTGEASEMRFLSAVSGGIMVGWGICLWMLATAGLREAPQLSRRIILLSIGTWFVLDSAGSLVAGVPLNVAGNVLFLLIFILPLRAFQKQPA